MTAPIAITGAGALTPLGDSPETIFSALVAGQSALAPAADHGGVGIAAIADFDYAKYAQVRNMRMYNRTTQLGICAAKLALTEAKIEAYAGEEVGLLMASTYGHLDVLLEYDRSLVASGLQRTNGALMPLAIPSAPGAMAALAFGAKAFSMTLADGGSSSLDAIGLGCRWLAEGRARACIVVSAFSASSELVLAASRAGMLAPAGVVRPFDRSASGTGLGQAAVAFVLERAEDAASRGALARGHVCGYGAAFAGKTPGLAGALGRASVGALQTASIPRDRIGLVSAGASGVATLDRAEAEGLAALLGDRAEDTPIVAVKGAFGETLDTAGALQALAALSSLEARRAPPIGQLENPEVPGLRYVTPRTNGDLPNATHALVTAVSRNGTCAALVLSGGQPS
jgi:3-oxoacyl-[acyl-carrier-protein] synthase II